MTEEEEKAAAEKLKVAMVYEDGRVVAQYIGNVENLYNKAKPDLLLGLSVVFSDHSRDEPNLALKEFDSRHPTTIH